VREALRQQPDVRQALIADTEAFAYKRLAPLPLTTREERARAASEYLVVEAAWSWAFFREARVECEIYPGPQHWLKEQVLAGRLPGAECLGLLPRPTFINCEAVHAAACARSSKEAALSSIRPGKPRSAVAGSL